MNIKKNVLLFVFLFVYFINSNAQHNNFVLPETNYKYKVIKTVCEKIANAQGANKPLPAIKVNARASNKHYVAYYNPEPVPEIQVDEEFYDICVSFGSDSLNALACILGHELSHHYNSHGLTYSFAELLNSELQENNISEANSQLLKLKETEADYFGLFYGYIAGFDNYQLFPAVLDSVYKHYKIPETLKNYPTKSERIEIGNNAVKKINQCVYVFKAAQFLYIKKEYQAATTCMTYLLNYFPSKEIYNNVAVMKMQLALEKMLKGKIWFSYPFEFDSKSRLYYSATRSPSDDDNEQIAKLIDDAIENLEKAIVSDVLYEPAYINLASAYSIKGNYDKSIGEVNELEELYKKNNIKLPGNAYLIRAISRIQNEQTEKAKTDITLAETNGADSINYNKRIFNLIISNGKVNDEQIQNFIYNWYDSIAKIKTVTNYKILPETNWYANFEKTIFTDTISIGSLNIPFIIYSYENNGLNSMKITLSDKEYWCQECNSINSGNNIVLNYGLSLEKIKELIGTGYKTIYFAWEQFAILCNDSKIVFYFTNNNINKFNKFRVIYK